MDNEYFMSINDVAKRLSVPAHTLRYWEKQFPSAIKPTTGAGGRRYYRSETVEKLVAIKDLLYVRGMTIAGVKKILHDGGLSSTKPEVQAEQPVATPINSDDIDTVISMLKLAKNKISNLE